MTAETLKKKTILNVDKVDFSDVTEFSKAINLEVLDSGETKDHCVLKLNSKQIDKKTDAENCLMVDHDFFTNPLFKNYLNMLLEGEFHNNYEMLFDLKELNVKELRAVNLKRVGHYTDLLVDDFSATKIVRNWREEVGRLFENLAKWKKEKSLSVPFELNYYVKDNLIILQCTTHYTSKDLMDLDLFKLADFSTLIFLNNPKTFIWNLFWYKDNPAESKNSLAIFSNMTLQKNNYIFRENDVYMWSFNNPLNPSADEARENSEYLKLIKSSRTDTDNEVNQVIKNVTEHMSEETVLVKSSMTFRDGLEILNRISGGSTLTEDEYLRVRHAHLVGIRAVHFLTEWKKSLDTQKISGVTEVQTSDKVVISGGETDLNDNFEQEVQRRVEKRLELLRAQESSATEGEKQLMEKQLKVINDKYNDLVTQFQERVKEEVEKTDKQAGFYKNESSRLNSEVVALKTEVARLEKEIRELQLIIRKKEAEEKSGANMKGGSDSKVIKFEGDKKGQDDSKDLKSADAKFKFKLNVLEKNLSKVEEEKKKALEDVSTLKAQAAKMKSENIALHNELEKVSNKLKRLSGG